jgi:hypothetical protein
VGGAQRSKTKQNEKQTKLKINIRQHNNRDWGRIGGEG